METILDQWYLQNKRRYQEEIQLMRKYCPFMIDYIDETTSNAMWTGSVSLLDDQGNLFPANCEYNPLEITIECLHDYPKSVPIVRDVKDVLRKHGCIHLYPDSNQICYGLRCTNDKCNFHLEDRLKNIVEQIGTFIYGQWHAEQNGGQWQADHKHGAEAIVEYEFKNGHIPVHNLCPCGKSKTYINCHLPEVQYIIHEQRKEYMYKIDKTYGRRKDCPCGSREKLKDCCEGRYIFYKNDNFNGNSQTGKTFD